MFSKCCTRTIYIICKKNEHRLRPHTLHKNKMSQKHEFKIQTDKTCRKRTKPYVILGLVLTLYRQQQNMIH